jgi:predicted Zn-dependent peptidase
MPDRSSPPPFVYNNKVSLLPAKRVGDAAGRVFLVAGGTQDVVRIEWVLPAGRWYEPSNGVAFFSAALLNKGTPKRTARQIAEALDSKGAHLEVHAGSDFTSVSLITLTRFLRDALEVVGDMLQHSVFPDDELRLARDNFLQTYLINLEKTSYLASAAIRKAVFGSSHPYGRELDPTSADTVTSTQLSKFFHLRRSPILTLVSGRVNEDDLGVLDKMTWAGRSDQPEHALAAGGATQLHIPKSGSVQSSVRLGKVGLDRRHTDYAEYNLLIHLLGGYFGSRLMKNLREEKGLTYGIYASLQPHRHAAMLTIGADVNAENRTLVIDEIRKEIDRLRTEPMGIAEIETGRNHLVGSLQSELTTPFAHADRHRMLVLNDLPGSFFQDMVYTMERTSPARLQELAGRYLHEDSFSIVTAG